MKRMRKSILLIAIILIITLYFCGCKYSSVRAPESELNEQIKKTSEVEGKRDSDFEEEASQSIVEENITYERKKSEVPFYDPIIFRGEDNHYRLNGNYGFTTDDLLQMKKEAIEIDISDGFEIANGFAFVIDDKIIFYDNDKFIAYALVYESFYILDGYGFLKDDEYMAHGPIPPDRTVSYYGWIVHNSNKSSIERNALIQPEGVVSGLGVNIEGLDNEKITITPSEQISCKNEIVKGFVVQIGDYKFFQQTNGYRTINREIPEFVDDVDAAFWFVKNKHDYIAAQHIINLYSSGDSRVTEIMYKYANDYIWGFHESAFKVDDTEDAREAVASLYSVISNNSYSGYYVLFSPFHLLSFRDFSSYEPVKIDVPGVESITEEMDGFYSGNAYCLPHASGTSMQFNPNRVNDLLQNEQYIKVENMKELMYRFIFKQDKQAFEIWCEELKRENNFTLLSLHHILYDVAYNYFSRSIETNDSFDSDEAQELNKPINHDYCIVKLSSGSYAYSDLISYLESAVFEAMRAKIPVNDYMTIRISNKDMAKYIDEYGSKINSENYRLIYGEEYIIGKLPMSVKNGEVSIFGEKIDSDLPSQN